MNKVLQFKDDSINRTFCNENHDMTLPTTVLDRIRHKLFKSEIVKHAVPACVALGHCRGEGVKPCSDECDYYLVDINARIFQYNNIPERQAARARSKRIGEMSRKERLNASA